MITSVERKDVLFLYLVVCLSACLPVLTVYEQNIEYEFVGE